MSNESPMQQWSYLKLVIVLCASGVSWENVLFCFMGIHTDTNSSHFKQAACTINNMNPTEKSSFHDVVLKSRQYFCCVFSVSLAFWIIVLKYIVVICGKV